MPRRVFSALVLLLSLGSEGHAQTKTIAERLGYPADTKLLIVHADDLAVAHSIDAASFEALDKNAVTSASIIVPCPWLNEVAAYAKDHPDVDLGLHLALTSEWKTYRWGPVESKDRVPSLLDPAGYLWAEAQPALQSVNAAEVERELRAQIERALAAGIHPTHLDSHMGVLFLRADLFAVYAKLAHEYHLPFLTALVPGDPLKIQSQLHENDVVVNTVIIATSSVQPGNWKPFYADAIKNLKSGLSEMIVHLGLDESELQAVTVDHVDYGSAWRQRDFDYVTGPEFKKVVQENHIVLVKWRDFQKLLK